MESIMNTKDYINLYNNNREVVEIIELETGHRLSESTISRVKRGKCTAAMNAFVRYALENIEKQKIFLSKKK